MKRAIVLAALPLACASSPAFVLPAAVAANRPKLHDVSRSHSAIAPHSSSALNTKNQQRRRGRRLEASLGGAGAPSVAGAAISSASFVLAWSPTAVVAVVGAFFAASVVNALQGGVRGDLGATPDKILGVPAEEATAEHVAQLGKAGFMQLFHASTCPDAGDLDGEYRARTLEMGILHPVTAIITHRIWGPGRWLGKGVRAGSSEGYNLFSRSPKADTLPSSKDGGGSGGGSGGDGECGLPSDTLRERLFRFSQASDSVFDKGTSARLDYAKAGKNGPLFGGMRDEIRKVNDKLFVGLGYIQAFGGKYNTAPFVLEGPPVHPFSAPDCTQ
eukprot:g10876.t1